MNSPYVHIFQCTACYNNVEHEFYESTKFPQTCVKCKKYAYQVLVATHFKRKDDDIVQETSTDSVSPSINH